MLERWESRYQTGDLPWDTRRVDVHLQRIFPELTLARATAVDLGCGTGTNALWLAEQGLEATGLDLSPTAIASAREQATQRATEVEFRVADLLAGALGGPWGFAYDRGCFHVFDEPAQRARFAEVVAAHLEEGGYWLSVIGSTDGPDRETGPPRRSLTEVTQALEPHFELVRVEAAFFDEHLPVMAWVVLARRREASEVVG